MTDANPFRTVHLPYVVSKLHEAYPSLASVHLFGSRRYRTGSVRSDIDLLVTFERTVPAMAQLGDFVYALDPYLDVFVANAGVAASAINGSMLVHENYDELVLELDAVRIWDGGHWVAGDNIEVTEETVLTGAEPVKSLGVVGGVHVRTLSLAPLCDVLVIAALKQEYDAVVDRLDEVRPATPPAHVPPFSLGVVMRTDGVERKVAIALLARMGAVSAALTTRRLLDYLSPELVVLVGLAGGIKEQGVQLGDVVVPSEIYEYEAVKVTPDGDKSNALIVPVSADPYARVKMWDSAGWQAKYSEQMPAAGPTISIRFDESMASGHKVIADEERANGLTLISRKTASIEMESFGVAEACRQAVIETPFLVIKSISDFADADKNDSWHEFCCGASADVLVTLLGEGFM